MFIHCSVTEMQMYELHCTAATHLNLTGCRPQARGAFICLVLNGNGAGFIILTEATHLDLTGCRSQARGAFVCLVLNGNGQDLSYLQKPPTLVCLDAGLGSGVLLFALWKLGRGYPAV